MPEPENTEFYAFSEKRHEKPERKQALNPDWRMVERLKTVSVAVCLCLNIGNSN